ncbi:TonB-dependent siderophore receptor [Cupriavidus sp. RAF12]|uniref:TonB-dependent siderophore receptor n=1 Tax=Cupriavidus sp. RAF12 TaxID=3233050 RepID=UPI003F900692
MGKSPSHRSPATASWRTRCAAATAGALLAVSMLAGGAPSARAQDNGRVADMRAFAIAPGPLTVTLNRFASAAGINLSYDAAQLADVRSDGLHGSYSVADGFRVLLAGSGLEAVPMAGGGYTVRRVAVQGGLAPDTLPEVLVIGKHDSEPPPLAGGQVAQGVRLGLLGNTDNMDAPFNAVGYTAEFIENQQARTVGDVLANDASVRYVSQPGGILDAFSIRGFPVGNGNFGEIAFDGVYGVASNYRVSTSYVERVELIKGPTAMLIGMAPSGSVGGGINILPKRAGSVDISRVTADYAAASQFGGSVDISRRLGGARPFGIRFNGSYLGGGTALDNQSRRATSGALALDVIDQRERISAPSRLLHIVPGIAVPEAPDGRRNISQPWEQSHIRDNSLLFRAEYDVANGVTCFANGGGGQTRVARLFAITPTIIDAAGDVAVTDSNYRFHVARVSADTGLRARFETGPVSHQLSVVASGYHDRLGRSFNTASTTSLTNLYAPAMLPFQDVPAPSSVPTVSKTTLAGVALADTLSVLDRRLQLTLGLRHQRVQSDNVNPDGAPGSRYDQGAWTPLVGLVVRPWQAVSFYANRIEGLSKGDIAPGSAGNAGEVFAPYKSRQYEVGVKLEQGGMRATLSAFQITKPGGELAGSMFAINGEQRNRGLEFGLYGEPTRHVRLLASATLLDATITRDADAGTVGKTAIGAPRLQVNFGAEWDAVWLPGLTLSGALAYTGRQYVDQSNTQSVPAWTRVDLGARYRTRVAGKETTFRLAVRNVFDRHYWAAVDSYGGLAIAEPRALMLSATAAF